MNLPLALLNLWAVVAFVFAISYIWRPNRFFTFVIHVILGSGSAHYFIMNVLIVTTSLSTFAASGQWIDLIFVLFGLLMLTTLHPRLNWLARYPTGIMVGTGLGLSLRAILKTQVIFGIVKGIKPLVTPTAATSVGNLVYVVVLCLSLYYFLFGWQPKGNWQKLTQVSRFVIYVAFGIVAGNQFFTQTDLRMTGWLTWLGYIEGFIANIT
jgi:hypothetical protein